MDPTEVVNIHRNEDFDIFIGRDSHDKYHYGNPFTHFANLRETIHVGSREEAVDSYRRWLHGDFEFAAVEPNRREWILENLSSLRGRVLGCFCKPRSCHGDVLVEMMEIIPDGR